MIDFRYHVVSIVAVFLALALGLFIGSTSLRGPVANDINRRTKAVTNENRSLQGELSAVRAQLNDEQSFETAAAPYILKGVLTGDSIVVVSAPGADDGARRRLVDALTSAGATVTADVRLGDPLLDPNQEPFLATLAGRLALSDHPLPAGSGSQRAVALLADVLGTRPQVTPPSPSAAARVLSAYSDGKLLHIAGGTARPGSLAVLLTAPPAANVDPKVAQEQQAVLLDLAADLDHTASGAVVAGPVLAAGAGGLLAAARDDKALRANVSTVDGVDTPSGLIATVLALAEQAQGGVGSYGSGAGADQPLPTPSPT